MLKSGSIDFNIVLFEKDWPINMSSLYKRCTDIANFRNCRVGSIIIT